MGMISIEKSQIESISERAMKGEIVGREDVKRELENADEEFWLLLCIWAIWFISDMLCVLHFFFSTVLFIFRNSQ